MAAAPVLLPVRVSYVKPDRGDVFKKISTDPTFANVAAKAAEWLGVPADQIMLTCPDLDATGPLNIEDEHDWNENVAMYVRHGKQTFEVRAAACAPSSAPVLAAKFVVVGPTGGFAMEGLLPLEDTNTFATLQQSVAKQVAQQGAGDIQIANWYVFDTDGINDIENEDEWKEALRGYNPRAATIVVVASTNAGAISDELKQRLTAAAGTPAPSMRALSSGPASTSSAGANRSTASTAMRSTLNAMPTGAAWQSGGLVNTAPEVVSTARLPAPAHQQPPAPVLPYAAPPVAVPRQPAAALFAQSSGPPYAPAGVAPAVPPHRSLPTAGGLSTSSVSGGSPQPSVSHPAIPTLPGQPTPFTGSSVAKPTLTTYPFVPADVAGPAAPVVAQPSFVPTPIATPPSLPSSSMGRFPTSASSASAADQVPPAILTEMRNIVPQLSEVAAASIIRQGGNDKNVWSTYLLSMRFFTRQQQ
jgi:hypothetical protein